MIAFIDDHRAVHGVEPICRELAIAPSTYHAHAARRADPSKASARTRRDDLLRGHVRRVWEENFRVYGVRKVWRQLAGFAYVAFVVDAYARRIVGWRVAHNMEAGFVLDALEQALHARQPKRGAGLIHHSDRGVQYLSIRYTERLAEAGIVPSVGSVGDSYDNALAETVIGLFKTEVIHRRGPWRNREAVELATLEWVGWFNTRRLLEPIGHIPPAEAENRYHAELATRHVAA
jgi:transposase InsO family protein